MDIKGLVDEDFVNYKKASMFISCPHCTFKCDKENGCQLCQNMPLAYEPILSIDTDDLIQIYLNNPITHAIVFGGLEPMDTFDDVYSFINRIRNKYQCDDDIVIYTGYDQNEITQQVDLLKKYSNIIVKFGRFRLNHQKHFDEILGVYLVSDNQYAKKIS